MPEPKQGHGCLTAYLVFMIAVNSAVVLVYTLGREALRRQTVKANLPPMPDWAFSVLVVAGLFNLICAIALFRWRKWGFWGFCLSALVALAVNLSIGIGVIQSLLGLLGLALLFAVLQIGKENKGWPQLE